MPIRQRIQWGRHNPFADSRLANLAVLVHEIRQHQRLPAHVTGGSIYENRTLDLPPKPHGFYREYDLVAPGPEGRDALRLILGDGGEVYLTGNHYDDFRQIIDIPTKLRR